MKTESVHHVLGTTAAWEEALMFTLTLTHTPLAQKSTATDNQLSAIYEYATPTRPTPDSW